MSVRIRTRFSCVELPSPAASFCTDRVSGMAAVGPQSSPSLPVTRVALPTTPAPCTSAAEASPETPTRAPSSKESRPQTVGWRHRHWGTGRRAVGAIARICGPGRVAVASCAPRHGSSTGWSCSIKSWHCVLPPVPFFSSALLAVVPCHLSLDTTRLSSGVVVLLDAPTPTSATPRAPPAPETAQRSPRW